MRFIAICLSFLLSLSSVVLAQSSPNLTYGQVPTAGQWNSFFSAKQDLLGFTPLNQAGGTMLGPLKTAPSSTSAAGFAVLPGVAPSLPNNGDVWLTSTGLYYRAGNITFGPIGAGTITGPATSAVGNIATWANTGGTSLQDSGKVLPAGVIVGTSDPQVLYNKSLVAPSISNPTVTGTLNGGLPAISVANQTALKALSIALLPSGFTVVRQGFSSASDGGQALYYLSTSACSLNSGAGDGGSQVSPNVGTGCWILNSAATNVDIRAWGAVGNNSSNDDGPAIRAACAYSATQQVPVVVPARQFWINSLDSSGLGGIVLNPSGNLTSSFPTPSCILTGSAKIDYPDSMGIGSTLSLGPGLNRPLVYVRKNAAVSLWQDLYLSGNRASQSGWAGGPNGSLFTIQTEDDGAPAFENGIRLNRVIVRDGYNGNFYVGAGRNTWTKDSWFQYSGQTTSDYSIYLNGYDSVFDNAAIGSNAGTGVMVAEGSQYQFTNGAIFLNGANGMVINGGKVNYLAASGLNFQLNGCNGVQEINSAPFAGSASIAHMFTNTSFDGNSNTTTNTCADIQADTNNYLTFSNVGFVGNASTTGNRPAYNISTVNGALVKLNNAVFGANSAATAWANIPSTVFCSNCNIENTWTPQLTGTTTAGSPTYVTQEGFWSRNNNEVTAHFKVQVSSLGGAAGNLSIIGLPYFNATIGAGHCSVTNWTGWTAQTGYTTLTAVVGTTSATILFLENGSGKSVIQTLVSELASASVLEGVCIYHTTN